MTLSTWLSGWTDSPKCPANTMKFRKNHTYYARRHHTNRFHPLKAKENPAAADGDEDTEDDDGDDTGDDAPEDGDEDSSQDEPGKTFTQDELNAIVERRLEREKAKREKEAEDAERDRARAELAKQKKYEDLADEYKGDLEKTKSDLETASDKVERYEAALTTYAEAAKEGLDKGVIALLDKLPIDEQLAWIAENKPATTSQDDGDGKDKSLPRTPSRGDATGKTAEAEAKRKAQAAQAYKHQF